MIVVSHSGFRFCFLFLVAFFSLYGLNIAFIGAVNPGGLYIRFLDEHLDYIEVWRNSLLTSSAYLLKLLGYEPRILANRLYVPGSGGIILSYSCLGYGLGSFFAAFAMAVPGKAGNKLRFILGGLFLIQILNVSRLILICLFWKDSFLSAFISHHFLFNSLIYGIIFSLIIRLMNGSSGRNFLP